MKDDVVFLQHAGRSFPLSSSALARETGDLLDKITSLASPGQRVFVGPADLRRTNYNDTFLYHLLPQLNPSDVLLGNEPALGQSAGLEAGLRYSLGRLAHP